MVAAALRATAPERWVYWLALACFLALSLAWLSQPGPYYDEWIFVPVSLRTLGECSLDAAVTHHLGCLPLTQAPPYVGAIKAWLMAPILALAGVGAWPVRLPPILLGLATLALLHRFLRPRLGAPAAAWTLLVLALDAALVWHTRFDWGPFAIANFCKLAAFAALLQWLERGRSADLGWLLAALCVGLFDKLNFLWVTAALGFSVLVVEPRVLLQRLRGATPLQWAMLGLAAGLHAFGLWALVIPAMEIPLAGIPDVIPFSERATALWHLYNVTFGGTSVHEWLFVEPVARARWPAIAQAALLAITPFAWWCLRRDDSAAARLFRHSSAVLVGLLACLLATRQVGGSHHVIVAWPFPVLQGASLLVALLQRSARPSLRRVLRGVAAGAVLLLASLHLSTDFAYARRLAQGGPYFPFFDPGLARVAAYLREHTPDRIVSAQWGLHVALLSLSDRGERDRYRDWWAIFIDPPAADRARTDYLRREFLAGHSLALVEWAAPPDPSAPAHADDYLRAWQACAGESREFAGSDGRPLVRVREFTVPASGACPP
jgi:hypothetical protein